MTKFYPIQNKKTWKYFFFNLSTFRYALRSSQCSWARWLAWFHPFLMTWSPMEHKGLSGHCSWFSYEMLLGPRRCSEPVALTPNHHGLFAVVVFLFLSIIISFSCQPLASSSESFMWLSTHQVPVWGQALVRTRQLIILTVTLWAGIPASILQTRTQGSERLNNL